MGSVGYDERHIVYVPGKVEDTLPANAPEQISLLRLDTDWYESTRHELECLFPRLAVGGVLLIDDYGHWKGAKRAVDEYFERHHTRILLTALTTPDASPSNWNDETFFGDRGNHTIQFIHRQGR